MEQVHGLKITGRFQGQNIEVRIDDAPQRTQVRVNGRPLGGVKGFRLEANVDQPNIFKFFLEMALVAKP